MASKWGVLIRHVLFILIRFEVHFSNIYVRGKLDLIALRAIKPASKTLLDLSRIKLAKSAKEGWQKTRE